MVTADPRCRRLSQLATRLGSRGPFDSRWGPILGLIYVDVGGHPRLSPPRAPPPESLPSRGARAMVKVTFAIAEDTTGRKSFESSFARKANAAASPIARRSIRHFIFYLDAVSHDEEAGRMLSSGTTKVFLFINP